MSGFNYNEKQSVIIRKKEDSYINWLLITGFEYLGIQTIEESKIMARINPDYLCRRANVVPILVQELIHTSSFQTII